MKQLALSEICLQADIWDGFGEGVDGCGMTSDSAWSPCYAGVPLIPGEAEREIDWLSRPSCELLESAVCAAICISNLGFGIVAARKMRASAA